MYGLFCDVVTCLCVTIAPQVIIVPMHATIWLDLGDGDRSEPASSWAVYVLDWLTVIIYLVDIFVSSRTAYYDKEDAFVVEPKKVRDRYLRSWFAVDAVGSFPYQLGAIWLPNR